MHRILNIRRCIQKTDSACCGPCALKQVADYYKIRNKNDKKYSKNSLIQICNTNKDLGTSAKDLRRAFYKIGLKLTKIPVKERSQTLFDIKVAIMEETPVIACIDDINDEFHYTIIKGFDNDSVILCDPYYGSGVVVSNEKFYNALKKCKWLFMVEFHE